MTYGGTDAIITLYLHMHLRLLENADNQEEYINMCGIVGYVGEQQAAPILLEGLSKLEYRGYDSAGIAVRDDSAEISVVKAKGRLKILSEKTDNGRSVRGTCGIGHTRWATHGEPSENNAHPHCTDDRFRWCWYITALSRIIRN